MKNKKSIIESIRRANEALEQANVALNNVMQELDDDELNAVTGAGDDDSFFPRVPTQPIGEKERNDI